MMILGMTLGHCTRYVAKPLPVLVDDAKWPTFKASVSQLELPALKKVKLDATQPWNMLTVAVLAVLHNPELESAAQAEQVAEAEAFSAGLLPDPQVQAGRERAMGRSTQGYQYGLGFDTGVWLEHDSVHRAAEAHFNQIRLDRYWQQWQVIAAAEQAFVQQVYAEQRLHSLESFLNQLHQWELYALQQEKQGLLRDDQLHHLHMLKASMERLRQSAELASEQGQVTLHTLLGLDPGVPVRLSGFPEYYPEAIHEAQSHLERLSQIRPDLRALQQGYKSQEERVRQAVLAQFPSVGVMLTRSRDVYEPVNALGLELQFSLPVLSGQQGVLATQKASRAQLYKEYERRVRQADFDVKALLQRLQILNRQLQQQQTELQRQTRYRMEIESAMQRNDAGIESVVEARNDEESLFLEREQTLRDRAVQTIALQLLTGSGVFAPEEHIVTHR